MCDGSQKEPQMTETPSLSPQDALVAVMIATSASDDQMRTSELLAIQRMIAHLPVFDGYDHDRMRRVANIVFDLFEEEEGLDALFGLIRESLPRRLHETAYAMACDVVTADKDLHVEELEMLEEIRDQLAIDKLHAAAIEWGARVRHMRIDV
jgi:tellurite resistance protein